MRTVGTCVCLATVALLNAAFDMPPTRYSQGFKGHPRVFYVDAMSLRRVCHDTDAAACAMTGGRSGCVIFIGESARYNWKGPLLLQHERAHCAGWPGNHPR